MTGQVWISEVMSNGALGDKLGIRQKWFGEPWEAPYVQHRVPKKSEDSIVAASLDFCDLSTSPRGERWPLGERLRDIVERHHSDSAIATALRLGRTELERNYDVGRSLLRVAHHETERGSRPAKAVP